MPKITQLFPGKCDAWGLCSFSSASSFVLAQSAVDHTTAAGFADGSFTLDGVGVGVGLSLICLEMKGAKMSTQGEEKEAAHGANVPSGVGTFAGRRSCSLS